MSHASIRTFSEEIESLKASWRTKSAMHLSNYLVVGYRDPRINLASILGRHYLVVPLNTGTVDQITADEIRHAVRLNGMLAHGDRPNKADLHWPAGAWRDALRPLAGRLFSVAIDGSQTNREAIIACDGESRLRTDHDER